MRVTARTASGIDALSDAQRVDPVDPASACHMIYVCTYSRHAFSFSCTRTLPVSIGTMVVGAKVRTFTRWHNNKDIPALSQAGRLLSGPLTLSPDAGDRVL